MLEFQPVDLSRFPAVDALLTRLGVGPFIRESLSAPVGRNDVWTGRTQGGRSIFVKRLVGPSADVRERMSRLLSFERFLGDNPAFAPHAPAFLGSDLAADLVVFESVEDAKTGARLMVDEDFDEDLAERLGRVIGTLHDADPGIGDHIDRSPPLLPELSLLEGLPLPVFDGLTFAGLSAWRLMQQDSDLTTAIGKQLERESVAPRVPSHCDFRVDQILVSDVIRVTDWEEFRLADPARDVGAFAGEWLYRSVLDIVTSRGDADSSFIDLELTHEQVLARGAEKLERLLPLVHAFWRGYRSVRKDIDDAMPVRATAFAGWHLLDRLIAGAAGSARLSGIERAAAGVGRRALMDPHRFAATLGFEESW
ncbi:class V lanthionine synthetase subunit LxmK [Thermocatellispora tengchongensis]|uniref:class V lanthionine synthetase subunit LxmK n=1 Tax=Thermocatellispora tengchongensis TaxID=1073253 RepID=UPI0036392D95